MYEWLYVWLAGMNLIFIHTYFVCSRWSGPEMITNEQETVDRSFFLYFYPLLVLYCIALYCIVLYCIALRCIASTKSSLSVLEINAMARVSFVRLSPIRAESYLRIETHTAGVGFRMNERIAR
jgi:hypothetical protein